MHHESYWKLRLWKEIKAQSHKRMQVPKYYLAATAGI